MKDSNEFWIRSQQAAIRLVSSHLDVFVLKTMQDVPLPFYLPPLMIRKGCWACNKCVYVQSDCHHFTTQSDSLFSFSPFKKSPRRPAPACAWRHFLTSAFTSHFSWKYWIWQNTQKATREALHPLPQSAWQESILIPSQGCTERKKKLQDESPMKSFPATPNCILLKMGIKMHLPQQIANHIQQLVV